MPPKECRNYAKWGQCPFSDCKFQHRPLLVNEQYDNYRTKLCKNIDCGFGDKCIFIHQKDDFVKDGVETFFSE